MSHSIGYAIRHLFPKTSQLQRNDLILINDDIFGEKVITVEDFLHEVARLIKEDREAKS